MIRMTIVLSSLALLIACEKKEQPPVPVTEAARPESLPPTTPAAAERVVDMNLVPVEEDFEQDAEQAMTSANLTAKLDEIEKEIGAQ